jgi:hypothetical protein
MEVYIMSIDMSTVEFGVEPEAHKDYLIRITGVWVRVSANTGSRYINLNGTIADGPSMGYQIKLPMIMLFNPANPGKTQQYLIEAAQSMAKYLGIDPRTVVLPTQASQSTNTLDMLFNTLFLARLRWVPEKADKYNPERIYPGYWESGTPIKAVVEAELAQDGVDYAAFFVD